MLPTRKQSYAEFDDEGGNGSHSWPPLSLIRILWKRKFYVLVTAATLSVGVLTVVMLWPATYRAETLILVDSQKIPEKFVSATVSAELQDRLATISQRILSNTRLQQIVETFKLYEKERKKLSQEEVLEIMRADIHMTVEKGWVQNRPGAFRVSYEGHNPNVVADVTNQLGSLFIEENLRARETIAEGTSDFMKSQLADAKKTLDEQEKRVGQYKLEHNGELPQQESALSASLAQLSVQLQGNQEATNRAYSQQATLQSAMRVAQNVAEVSLRLNKRTEADQAPAESSRPVVERPEESLKVMETELATALTKYTEAHPRIKELRASVAQLRAQVDKEQLTAAGDPQHIESLKAQLAAVDREISDRTQENQRLLQQIHSMQSHVGQLPIREQEMAALTRDYEMAKANYKSLLDKLYAADMATDMERRQKSERFTVLDPARVPEKPISPNRRLFAGLGSGGALVLSIGFWLFADIRKNKFMGEWELPEDVVVLGRVPVLSTAGANRRRKRWTWRRVAAPATMTVLAIISVAAKMAGVRY
jgi:polysaccharide chain length determinant protein (PEP-CTERM system associated)